jgi:hypothetical protein
MESHHSVEGCSGLPVLKINVLVSATERKRSPGYRFSRQA